MTSRNLYDVLGVRPGARKAEIERAVQRLERKHHPSLNPGDGDAAHKYSEVRTAMEVLTTPALRREYDRTGRIPSAATEGTQPGVAGRAGASKGLARSDLYVTVQLELLDAIHGAERTISFQGARLCEACVGSGCSRCRDGIVEETMSVTVAIPPGVDSGSALPQQRPDAVPGNLVVVTSVSRDPFFERLGDNLQCEVPVSVPEAALGARIEVPTPFGRASVKVPPGTQSGQKLRLRERGVPSLRGGARGDLYAIVKVVTPAAHDERSRKVLRELALALKAAGDDPRASLPDPGVATRRR